MGYSSAAAARRGSRSAQDLPLLAHAEYEKKWIGYYVRHAFLEKPLGPRRAGKVSLQSRA